MAARREVWYGHRGPPVFPTRTEPGSPERIDTYRDRLEAGFQMHHPQDVRIEWPAPNLDWFLRMIDRAKLAR